MSFFSRLIGKKNIFIVFFLLFFIIFINKFFTFSLVKESYNYVLPKKIRTFIQTENGPELKRDFETPTPADDEILVKVRSYVVGNFEYCKDFSGVVISKGKSVEDFEYKNRVFGTISDEQYNALKSKNIICPEVIAIKIKNKEGKLLVSKKPLSLTHTQASNIPYITDYLIEFIDYSFNKNDEILVTNGVSILGSALIYYLKNDAKILATEEDKSELSKFKLISYQDFTTEEEFKKHLISNQKKFDYIFNIPGSTLTDIELNLILKEGGTLIDLNTENRRKIILKKGAKLININGQRLRTAEEFDKIADLINTGKIPIMIEKVFEMENLKEALKFKQNNKYNFGVNIAISKEP